MGLAAHLGRFPAGARRRDRRTRVDAASYTRLKRRSRSCTARSTDEREFARPRESVPMLGGTVDEAPYAAGAPIQVATLRNDPEYVAYLERRISALEQRLPQTQLLSPKFLRRAFAVLGHYFVAALLLEIVLFVVFAVIFGLAAGVGALFHLG